MKAHIGLEMDIVMMPQITKVVYLMVVTVAIMMIMIGMSFVVIASVMKN